MTTELTKAAQQALEAFDAFADADDFPTCFELTKKMNALRNALTQRPAAQTEREAWVPYRVDRADGVKGLSLEEADSLLRQITIPTIRASLPAAQQATPEPVGEPFGWLFQHEETGRVQVVDSQQVEWGFETNNQRWQKIRPVYTHPAPGVPEGFALVPMTEDELNEMALQLGREMKGLRCWGWMDLVRAVERHHSKKLAAAQAKGDAHD